MEFLTNLINKIGLFVFLIALLAISVYFMATRSDFHKNAIGVKSMAANAYVSNQVSSVKHFWNLPDENRALLSENAALKNKISEFPSRFYSGDSSKTRIDSSYRHQYSYFPAEVIDYSLRKKDNYFLINKGKKDGIKEDMAVLSPNGIVGAVLSSSDHYSSVISVLHSQTNIKARIKGLEYFGIVVWPGIDHQKLALTEIPKYLKVEIGDTVMTAGASASYPEGALIGVVSELEANDDTGDFEITVTTFDDLAKVRGVYVVENIDKIEIDQLKKTEDAITQ
ncbi:MAG: rod shape-determining protein MreC [Flavobacteriaceae bacterium]|nr:rod shape-determining protein MreC [Flavobacteriaceae bacterium]